MDILKKGIVITLFLFSCLTLFKVLTASSYPDFTIYYNAVHVWLEGLNPYLKIGNLAYFLYPPISLLFLLPLLSFPIEIAGKLWIVANIVLLLITLKLLFSLYKVRFFSIEGLCILLLVFIAFPTRFTLGMGQINIVIFFFITSMYYFIKKKKDFESGIFLGFSILLKLQPLLFIVYFLLKKRWRVFGGFFIVIMVGVIFSLVFIPEHVFKYYFLKVVPDLLTSFPKEYYNQSLSGFLGRQFPGNSISPLIRMILSGLIVCTTFIFIQNDKKKHQEIFHLNILLVTQLLINNISWQHYYILLTLPLVHLYIYIKRSHHPWYYDVILAVIFILIGINIKHPENLPMILTSHVFYGSIILWLFMLNILKKYD